jgi:signal peptidase
MTTAFRTVRWLLDAALVLLVGTVLALVLAAKVGPLLGHQTLIIRGGSMEPSIPSGSLVDVTHVQAADLAAGDVVAIKAANDVFVTHRVNRVIQLPAGLYIETKGDANEDPDPTLVAVSAVTGRVDFSLPLLGYIMFMLTTLPGIASIICLALTLVLALQLLEDLEGMDDGDPTTERWLHGDRAVERRLEQLAAGRRLDEPTAIRLLADPPIGRWPEGPTWWPPLPDSTEGRWPSEPPAGRLLEDPAIGRWLDGPTWWPPLADSTVGCSPCEPPAGRLLEDPAIGRWLDGPTWWPPLADSTVGCSPCEPPAGRLLEDPELALRLVEPRVSRSPEEPMARRRLAPPAGEMAG